MKDGPLDFFFLFLCVPHTHTHAYTFHSFKREAISNEKYRQNNNNNNNNTWNECGWMDRNKNLKKNHKILKRKIKLAFNKQTNKQKEGGKENLSIVNDKDRARKIERERIKKRKPVFRRHPYNE